MTSVEATLHELSRRYSDTRIHFFDVLIQARETDRVILAGKVLDQGNITMLEQALRQNCPELEVDISNVQVLRCEQPRFLTVATNLTCLQRQPSFHSEMVSQLVYGWPLEILLEQNDWALVRQMDGYMGWAYRPYLREKPAPEPTHLVVAPVCEMRASPHWRARVVTRVVCGTSVRIIAREDGWAEVIASQRGWVRSDDLRSYFELPKTASDRRETMLTDAARMVGVPYEWGGSSAHGIDSAGFAQLLHRWVGIIIPRDADMQYASGTPVEPPFEVGDLIFLGEDGNRTISDAAVSTGGWNVIHSSRAQNGVYYDDIQAVPYLRENFLYAASYLR
jgi:SH3-like domain-containing protein